MSRRKVERLLNLTMCLMSSRRFLSVEEIGRLVDGYEPDGTEEQQGAFRRMFERDKEELRELGVPLVTGSNTGWDDEQGYRIARSDYALPDIELLPDEATALALAARLWTSASLAGAGQSALRKLRAAGADPLPPPPGLEPQVDAREPAFEPLLAAVSAGRVVQFSYRRPGADAAATRTVEPWGVVSWHGHWYFVGYDRDRESERVFRLSRIESAIRVIRGNRTVEPPADLDLRAAVASSSAPTVTGTATLRVRRDAAHGLRRMASTITLAPGRDEDLLEVPYGGLGRLAGRILWFGADVVVLDPPELRDLVISRLRDAAGGAS